VLFEQQDDPGLGSHQRQLAQIALGGLNIGSSTASALAKRCCATPSDSRLWPEKNLKKCVWGIAALKHELPKATVARVW